MARLNLHLLGPPRIERDGVPIKVDTRKAIALLAYIAITRESHSRSALVNLLWPEYDQARGRAALRRTLSALRKALAGDWLEAGRQNVGLNRGAGMWLDVDQFHGHLGQCLTHGHLASEVCPACLDPLTDAVALCRGDFLSGFSLRDSFNFDDWQFFQTDSLRRELAGALERLAQCHSARGEFERAIDYARRWVALDRLDESAHCQLMRLCAWSGQRSAALRQYQECVRILESQLGISPQDSTTALFGAIQEGRAPPPSQQLRRLRGRMEHQAPPAPEAPRDVLDEKKRIATILLADISGSFRWMADISPEDQASLVNRFLGVVQDTLSEYGVQIYRCLGASVLAVFGTGQTHESDPELAIRAAIDIRREAAELALGVTAAVTTGQVYLSAMGSEGRGAFTLMGAVLDLAVGLAGQAQVGQIVVGGSTYRLTRRAFQFTPLSLSIQGMAHPAVVYQVERLLPQPRKARGIEGLRAELIGRNEELAKLKEALAELLDERGHMVSLIGEAGVGKSRLVAELKEFALTPRDDTARPLWLEGRCLELGMTASYSPFIDVFRGYFAWGAEDDDGKRRERIFSSLGEMVERGDLPKHRVQEMAALLGNLLSVRVGDEWEERLREDDPEQIRRQTFAAVRDFLVALSKQQPLVLVFEDLHWADSLSLDLVSLMMEALRLGPLLLLCVYRPEREHKCRHLGIIGSQKCRERYTELRLRELTHEQSRQLVGSLLSIDDLTPAVRDVILDRSQGNPFFIEEVVHSLIETGILYREAGFWRVRNELDSAVVPETIQRVVLTRVDHLDDESKHILQIASVIGRVFQPRVLERVAQGKADLVGGLWELEDRALIYQERAIPEVEYSFKHVLAQEAVYESLLGGRRRAIHRQVAEAIEALYPSSLQEYYEQLAYHYDRSGSVQRAVDYLLRAGQKAKRSCANEEAIAHLSRGLELLKTLPAGPQHDRQELDLQLALGVPLVHTRGHGAPEVERVYTRARELSERESDPSQISHVVQNDLEDGWNLTWPKHIGHNCCGEQDDESIIFFTPLTPPSNTGKLCSAACNTKIPKISAIKQALRPYVSPT